MHSSSRVRGQVEILASLLLEAAVVTLGSAAAPAVLAVLDGDVEAQAGSRVGHALVEAVHRPVVRLLDFRPAKAVRVDALCRVLCLAPTVIFNQSLSEVPLEMCIKAGT